MDHNSKASLIWSHPMPITVAGGERQLHLCATLTHCQYQIFNICTGKKGPNHLLKFFVFVMCLLKIV